MVKVKTREKYKRVLLLMRVLKVSLNYINRKGKYSRGDIH